MSDHEFCEEVRALLERLRGRIGATRIAVHPVDADGDVDVPPQLWRKPLGQHGVLSICRDAPLSQDAEREAEQSIRALRIVMRRWERDSWPSISVGGSPLQPKERLLARIHNFLVALAATEGVEQAILTLRGDIVTKAREANDFDGQLAFLLRAVDRAALSQKHSSHVELQGPQYLAKSFWYGATLIAFYDERCSVDFLRQRLRMVTRELVGLIADWDEDEPPDPAKLAPVPDL